MSIRLWVRGRERPLAPVLAGAYFTASAVSNTTPAHAGCRPFRARHRRQHVDRVCLPRWVSDLSRRRRDLNPNRSRDRAVCFRVTPRRHATAIAPGRIELPTSGSKVPRPSPTETPGLHSAAAICWYCVLVTALWSAHRSHTSAPLSGTNRVNVPRASPRQLNRDGRHCQAEAGGRPVFPGPERVIRVRATLCGRSHPDITGRNRVELLDAIFHPKITVRFHTLTA